MIDTAAVRAHFPSLERQQNGKPIIYFDNPAGTQVPQETIEGYRRYLECDNANVGGTFATSRETDALIAELRSGMADFLGASSPDEIIFGPNMTTLAFGVSHALGRILQPGDEIVTTHLEHDANVAPWLALQERGVVVQFIDITPDAMLDLPSAEDVITDRTRLLAVGYASNAFGTVNDVRRLADMAHNVGAWVFVDAVHYGAHGPIDVAAIGADLLVCSSYKFFGPHLGILWGRRDVLQSLPAYHVRPAGDAIPGKWETGTQNHEAFGALLGTLAYLETLSPERADRRTRLHDSTKRIRRYERTLSERLIGGLLAIPGVRIYGITDPSAFDRRVPTVSFTVEGQTPEQVSERLGQDGIFSWSGNHYAVEPMARLGLESTNRIGLTHYNTPQEIDRFLEALETIARP